MQNLNGLSGLSIGEISPVVKCWTTKRRLALRWSQSKAALVDLQRTDLRFECRARNAEPCGSPRCSEHPSAARPQRLLDDFFLMSGQRTGQRESALDGGPSRDPALIHREFIGLA